jgi:hypothetical protein
MRRAREATGCPPKGQLVAERAARLVAGVRVEPMLTGSKWGTFTSYDVRKALS